MTKWPRILLVAKDLGKGLIDNTPHEAIKETFRDTARRPNGCRGCSLLGQWKRSWEIKPSALLRLENVHKEELLSHSCGILQ